jgi:glucose/arabinose dehydrogenase
VFHSILVSLVITITSATMSGAPARSSTPALVTGASPSVEIPRMRPIRVFRDVKFKRPIQVVVRPDRPDELFVVEQPGRVLVLDRTKPDESKAKIFLDIRPGVRMKHNEEGLLSMAFSPDVETDATFYLYYTASSPRRAVLSRFKIAADGTADPESEEVLLEVAQPFGNHNGGTVLVGPDGMLYLAVGDGGAANDPLGHGQNLGTLLATVLRIDPSGKEGDRAYKIPADNPFVESAEAKPEIWAYGLRNIWRMSFDRETGELWAGDVGQNQWEEIDVIRKGGNYGWRYREGTHQFDKGTPPEASVFIDPVVDYPRSDGISVTGGFVYRGTARPAAVGVYLYADYQSGRIWGLRAEDGKLTEGPKQIARLRNSLISSFGEDADGELWLCTFEGDAMSGEGAIWRFTGPLERSVANAGDVDAP